jgi:glycosyltransferase involved in cell wall biosynthesis
MKRSALTRAIDNHLEKSVVDHASLNVFVTPATKEDFIKKYPEIAGKSDVLYWGYDADAFNNIPIPEKKTGHVKTLVHAGNIFDFQNPVKLWEVIAARINSGRHMKIKFIGTVSPLVKKSIAEAGLENITEYTGYLPYHTMLTELLAADYLLVCATERRHIPGKLYEYMHAGNPIIAFADDNPDIEGLLKKTGTGILYSYSEVPKDFFERADNLKPDKEAVLAYDRRRLTAYFAKLLLKLKA